MKTVCHGTIWEAIFLSLLSLLFPKVYDERILSRRNHKQAYSNAS